MNIIVCLKQVPGTTEVKIDPQTNTLVRQGIESIINPFDTYALEEAVRIKEKHGGKVYVITMGPPQAETALREAISLGADEAVLIKDAAGETYDGLRTARAIAAAVRGLSPVIMTDWMPSLRILARRSLMPSLTTSFRRTAPSTRGPSVTSSGVPPSLAIPSTADRTLSGILPPLAFT